MDTDVTATDAARRFSDLLNRVRYRGESFRIVRGGQAVARLSGPGIQGTATARRLVERLAQLPPPDPGFADALEATLEDQGLLPEDPWAT